MITMFDPAKKVVHLAKHGIFLAEAARLDGDNALVTLDDRREYGELRQVVLAPMHGRLWVVGLTDRPEGRRVISLRKANLRECVAMNKRPKADPPTSEEDAAITATALGDPDNPPFTDQELDQLAPMCGRPRLARPKMALAALSRGHGCAEKQRSGLANAGQQSAA